ncbi:hypothetical protein TEA_009234 [Camellia sinensis var. sinensis]|uniref:non-specific serine/threonine protein kinase n=1 Tax=Camellia sinensis var. sinensis TaxID=542762 RepID=A0A4S4ED63_CAMSN|nr:hypothetical protein TEA_009234 [Camellia sinensis var. sinensis]
MHSLDSGFEDECCCLLYVAALMHPPVQRTVVLEDSGLKCASVQFNHGTVLRQLLLDIICLVQCIDSVEFWCGCPVAVEVFLMLAYDWSAIGLLVFLLFSPVSLFFLGLVPHQTPGNWIDHGKENGANQCNPECDKLEAAHLLLLRRTLASMGLTGQLSGDIQGLSELRTLSVPRYKPILLASQNPGWLQFQWSNSRDNRISAATEHFVSAFQQLQWTNSTFNWLFGKNKLSGKIPSTLGLVKTLEILFLSNNQLTGPFPDLTGLNSLNHVMMEDTGLEGQIPNVFFSLPLLRKVVLRNNKLNGTLVVNSNNSNHLQLIDLQNNYITDYMVGKRFNSELILVGNPVCEGAQGTEPYCIIQQSNSSYSTEPKTCMQVTCKSHQISSPNCRCAYPYTGLLILGAPSFNVRNSNIYTSLENYLMRSFQSYQLPVDSVSLSKNPDDSFIILSLEVFPYGVERFDRTGISGIAFVLSNMTFHPMKPFGPLFFIADPYSYFAGIYAFHQKRRAEISDKQNNPFASWHRNESNGGAPQLKGARCFSFEELKKYTNTFSDANCIGVGGYGKVYRGTLPSEQLVAIKRAKQGSTQGDLEFKSELELLSRVHHKNVVSLVGFCFEQDEQMLVYEYIANGTLKESLSGKSGLRLDWMRRLRIALGAARGLQYLHELANPPIIHRDIKSNNILLDEYLNAKVSDFGLSKSIGDPENCHITTQIKGTMGYLDPEYCMTQQLTEKSDVYGFGVLMIELITAKQPIEKGKYIVREVRQKIDETKDLYDLHEIIDPNILGTALKGLEKFVDLAMRCVEEEGAARPTMGEVVKEIENIMQIASWNPNADSVSTSVCYEETSNHPYIEESLIMYSRTLAC